MGVARAAKLVAVPDPARAKLRAAIDEAAAAQRALTKGRAAVERAQQTVAGAEKHLQEASAAVGQARKAETSRVSRSGAGGAAPAATMREARERRTDAVDGLDVARAILEKASAPIADLEEAHARAVNQIVVCTNAVIAGAVPSALERYERARAELNAAYRMLRFLVDPECNGEKTVAEQMNRPFRELGRSRALAEVRALAEPVLRAPPLLFEHLSDHPALAPWRAAYEALQRDADAPLPTAVTR